MEHELVIQSMHCEHCAANVQRYVRAQPGVESADLSFETGRLRLVVGPTADVEELVEQINAMGYDASRVERS